MTAIIKKLRSRRGETLVELLVSVAILALAITILAGMLATAYRLNEAARAGDNKMTDELKAAELLESGGSEVHEGTVSIDGAGITVDVEIYGSGDFYSYKLK